MIAPVIEKRIAALERENLNRKVAYPVAGSLMRFIAPTSQVFTVSGGNLAQIVVRIRFTPEIKSENGIQLTELIPIVSTSDTFSNRYPKIRYINEPQVGDDTIILRLAIFPPTATTTFYIRVAALGISEGVFTQL